MKKEHTAEEGATRRRLPRAARGWLIGLAAVVVLYAVIGFFVVPPIAHRQIEQRGSAALDREVTLGDFGFNPFTFVAELEQLRVGGRDGDRLLTLENAVLNFDAFESLFRWQWRFGDIELTAPHARLAVNEAGELSIADLFAKDPEQPDAEPAKIPAVGVDRFVVERGTFEFDDRSRDAPFKTVVQPLAFTLEDFSTDTEEGGTYRLSGSTEAGESFTWSGRISAVPFSSTGHIAFSALAVPDYQPFVSQVLAGEIRSGKLDFAADYEISLGQNRRVLVRGAQLKLADAAVALPEAAEPAVVLPLLELAIPEADLLARTAHVAHLRLDGLAVRAVREPEGTIDLTNLLATRPTEPAAADPSAEAAAEDALPLVRVDEVSLRNGVVELTDRTLPEPAQLRADELALTLNGASTAPEMEAKLELSLRWQDGPGTLQANGTVAREPLKANLTLTGSQLELAAAAPYLQPFVDVQIESGRAQIDGRLEIVQAASEPLAVRWTGRMAIEELATRDRAFDHEFVNWSRLAIEGMDVSLAPRRVAVQEIRLEQPAFNVVLGPEGRTNLGAASSAETPAEGAEIAEAATTQDVAEAEPQPGEAIREASAAMPITLGNFVIAGGRVTLLDRSGQEPIEVGVTDIEGSLRGLSSERNEAGELALTAMVLDSAQATVNGKVNLVGTDVFSGSDVTLELRQVGLNAFEPYVVRFLGHRVQQGQMLGDFDYRLSSGNLDGKNHIVLDDFFLGEAVDSPDALNVPVKLALAVLRNRDGEVVLDVPVSGSLTAPEFNFGQAIRDAFGNILGRVASAPFALLGSMFGAPEMDLSEAEFQPGSVELTEEARRKLEVLTRALQERPGLKLVVEWEPTPEADREAARRQQLNELIAQKREQLATAREGAEVTEAEALRALHAERAGGERVAATQTMPSEPTREERERESESPTWYAQVWSGTWGPLPGAGAPAQTAPVAPAAAAEPQIGEEQLRQELLASIEIDEQALEQLAQARAQAAREQLASAGIDPNRIEVVRDRGEAEPAPGPEARIEFELAQRDAAALAE